MPHNRDKLPPPALDWWKTSEWIYTCHTHGMELAREEILRLFPSLQNTQVRPLAPGLIKVSHPEGHSPFLPGTKKPSYPWFLREPGQECAQATGLGGPVEDPAYNLWSRHRQPVGGVFKCPLGQDQDVSLQSLHVLSEGLIQDAQLDRWPSDLPLRISVRQAESRLNLSGGQMVRLLREKLGIQPNGGATMGGSSEALSGAAFGDSMGAFFGDGDQHPHPWHFMVTLVGESFYWGYGYGGLLLSGPLGGQYHYRKEDLRYSRAASKLLEAFEVFPIAINLFGSDKNQEPKRTASDPSRDKIALDVGAAPGGWTGVLLEKGFHKVYAVDPAELDPGLRQDPRVIHLRQKAESISIPPKSLALIVCDANWKAESTLKTIGHLSGSLRSGGEALLTLKLMGAYQKTQIDASARRQVWDDLERFSKMIKQNYQILGLRQLFHNRHELTAYLRKI
jgi:hypothetical protein